MRYRTAQRGFTLIELMVSLAIFSIIVVIVGGAYLNMISVQRQARALNNLVNNLTFVSDDMSRSMRTGTDYCGDDLGDGSCGGAAPSYTSFFFHDQRGCLINYYLSGTQLVEDVGGGGSCPNFTAEALTDPSIKITKLSFNAQATGRGAGTQSIVIYTISGQIKVDAIHTQSFTIESTAVKRIINI